MRALLGVVIGMGVLIVVAVVTLVALVAHRLSGSDGTTVSATLQQPPGTHIVGAVPAGGRLAIQLQGGGPDRVVVLDLRSGAPVAQIGLAP